MFESLELACDAIESIRQENAVSFKQFQLFCTIKIGIFEDKLDAWNLGM